MNWLCSAFFINRGDRRERREDSVFDSSVSTQLHSHESLHIKNLRALGVLGGKITELALFCISH